MRAAGRRSEPGAKRSRDPFVPALGGSAASVPPWWGGFLAALYGVAALWRVLALIRLSHGPLLEFVTADSQTYWDWSGLIRSGHWFGTEPFFLGPLCAFWIAGLRTLVGDSIARVSVAQSFTGAAAVVILTDAVRRVASARAAVPVGIVLAGYSMLVLFDAQMLSESLLFLLLSGVLWCLIALAGRPHGMLLPIAIGLLIGTMALGRATALLLLVSAMFILVSTRARRSAWSATVAMLMIVVAIAIPTAVHHRRVTGEWIPYTYSLGYNLYVGNGPTADGSFVLFTGADEQRSIDDAGPEGGTGGDGRAMILDTKGVRLSAEESSRYFAELAWTTIIENPLRSLKLFGRKLVMLLVREELPQIQSATVYERASGTLGWPVRWEFAFFAVLGLAGLVRAWRSSVGGRGVVLAFFAIWLGTAVFFVVDRYRVHLVAPLAVMAGCAIESVLVAAAGLHWTRVGELAAGATLGAAFAFAPIFPPGAFHPDWDLAVTYGDAWLAQGDPTRALPYLEQAAFLGDSDRGGSSSGASAAVRAGAHENLGIARERLGDPAGALEDYRAALDLAPEARSLRARYGALLAVTGAIAESREQFRLLGVADSVVAQGFMLDAVHADARGDTAGVRRLLFAASEWASYDERVVIPLVRLEIQAGMLADATARLDVAREHGLDPLLYSAHQSWIAKMRGDQAAATRWLESIPPVMAGSDPRIAGTLALAGETIPAR